MKVARKNGYIGGRIGKRLQESTHRWADEHLCAKSEILEFALHRFLIDKQMQDDFLNKQSRG